ncbi:MAG TPA: hypothetical protein VNM87_09395 [Candidatus Udaeobacter sp.]|nr:hypothetical protein [Candidatus Udaeobacter sp.]
MTAHDHAIQNQVRAILFRRFVDLNELTFGSVNGVVYLRGAVRRNPLFPAAAGQAASHDPATVRWGIERDVRAIEGVKDVIFDLEPKHDSTLGNSPWQPTTSPSPTPER